MQADYKKSQKKAYIICVDDEKFVLDSLLSQLQNKFKDSYEYEIAESGEEALEIIKDIYEEGNIVALIITDQLMPRMTGDEVLIKIHSLYPKPIKLLLTGQATLESAINAINNANLFSYLRKPWDEEGLLLAVEKGLTQHRLLENLENQVATFRKFVPRQFLEMLLIKEFDNIEPEIVKNLELSILFCDIIGYSTLSELLTPEQIFNLLNRYFNKINPIIEHNQGFIDKFLGDGIIALFKELPQYAVQAGIEILKILDEFNEVIIKEGLQPIVVGIGINTGQVVLGTLGTKDRIDDTAIGDAVNVASRIESLNRIYNTKLLITGDVLSKLPSTEQFKIRFIDKVKVIGKSKITELYEVFDADSLDQQSYKLSIQVHMEKACQLYQSKDFFAAQKLFVQCLEQKPSDQLLLLYIERCKNFIANGCPEAWDGATICMVK
ncbi:adenylate/guanylate cyclase domain-containing protein [Candidatus Trichorickettsia mobilis]|uniref:adenylate/guanylate cyclase domain-containing protein n=1 Tax=Candidatus Trichorickettsia mobilis TaxID=1346319 RepID=UPI0029302075|nr:adenylate/guanylate cyclase domain-containing protein [Candidatus Trichorickettsia mobilis]